MTTAITKETGISEAQLEEILVSGNLEKLTAAQRLDYYAATCKSLGLNPLTKPFAYIRLNGKITLYALKETTDQLRKIHGISIKLTGKEMIEESYVVTAVASDADGRTDESTGAVPLTGLRGDAHANALMKAETKAKRRVTLSLAGLGMLDETETESIAGAQPNVVNIDTGEFIIDNAQPETSKDVSRRQQTSAPAAPPVDPIKVVDENGTFGTLDTAKVVDENPTPATPDMTIEEDGDSGEHFCNEHGVPFVLMTNPATNQQRWVHERIYEKPDGTPAKGWHTEP